MSARHKHALQLHKMVIYASVIPFKAMFSIVANKQSQGVNYLCATKHLCCATCKHTALQLDIGTTCNSARFFYWTLTLQTS